jgi:hypothetical protein
MARSRKIIQSGDFPGHSNARSEHLKWRQGKITLAFLDPQGQLGTCPTHESRFYRRHRQETGGFSLLHQIRLTEKGKRLSSTTWTFVMVLTAVDEKWGDSLPDEEADQRPGVDDLWQGESHQLL